MTRMQTVSQKWVNLADPTAAMIDFFDIAHALCRAGNVVGKTYMTALSLPLVWGVRRALSRHTIHRGSEVSNA